MRQTLLGPSLTPMSPMTDAHPPSMSAASPGSDCIPQGADTAEHTVGIQITAERIFQGDHHKDRHRTL